MGGKSRVRSAVRPLGLDFTDRHYYGQPEKMPELKDCDLKSGAIGAGRMRGEEPSDVQVSDPEHGDVPIRP